MATAGASFAEVHVMRKLYKQKLKKIEAQKIKEIDSTHKNSSDFEEKEDSDFAASNGSSYGCFFWSRKKIHPNLNRKLGTPTN